MKDYSRRLQVTVAGRWYLALTIIIGVTAITTGNNSIYAIESLLLSALILSGILSERVIKAIDVQLISGHVIAKSSTLNSDKVVVKNDKNRHLFCIEIGEWVNGTFIPIAWVAHLKPFQTLIVRSRRIYESRGIHRWVALAIATRYPFGFARKIRFKNHLGERIVWPSLGEGSIGSEKKEKGKDPQQGEIRPMQPDDDFRSIVWTLSNKGLDPVVRTKQYDIRAPDLIFDIRGKSGAEFEKKVSLAARPFFELNDFQSGTLILIDSKGRRTFRGKISILNQLAVIQPDSRKEKPE